MINYIIGSVEYKSEGIVVLETNGIGYEIFVSNNTLSALPLKNETCKIFTYLQVKEDSLTLYGFSNIEEKEMFLKLISISGVGPKIALAVLSVMSLSDLIIAISSGDKKSISRTKGLGTKTAERIILELKDKVTLSGETNEIENNYNSIVLEQAIEALISLGISKNDSFVLAKKAITDTSTPEEIVTKVLKGMV